MVRHALTSLPWVLMILCGVSQIDPPPQSATLTALHAAAIAMFFLGIAFGVLMMIADIRRRGTR
jgi:hypothetical protein